MSGHADASRGKMGTPRVLNDTETATMVLENRGNSVGTNESAGDVRQQVNELTNFKGHADTLNVHMALWTAELYLQAHQKSSAQNASKEKKKNTKLTYWGREVAGRHNRSHQAEALEMYTDVYIIEKGCENAKEHQNTPKQEEGVKLT